ncbi:pentapeptide repeat-containing protein [Anaeromyxobacter diazotrophicus]|uniref:Pentapeptide repeat protein n=1 Tax=Anaeromyxobacter diazotrophicus TaxID=2590199 RepID=A0A7I9VKK8_9BACT|nr:pentapeptide repeat-containing protein [Anaeromyxobacter diazotrophicus]GEJ56718.1 hypothetical protein AMYX_14590 [Anaeromyxobacter diazotrophicus]
MPAEQDSAFWSRSWPRTTAVVALLVTLVTAIRELGAYWSDERQKWNDQFQQFITLASDSNPSRQVTGIAAVSAMWKNSTRDDHVIAELVSSLLLSDSEPVRNGAASAIGASTAWRRHGHRCDPDISSLLFGKGGDWGVVTRVAHMLGDSTRQKPLPAADFGCLTGDDPDAAVRACRARLAARPHQPLFATLGRPDQVLEQQIDAVREAVHSGKQCLRDANLRGFDLRGVALYGADLRGANLQDVDLCGATLWNADLTWAWGLDVNRPDRPPVAKTSLALANVGVRQGLSGELVEAALTRCHAVAMYDFDQFYRWSQAGYDLPAADRWKAWRDASYPVDPDGRVPSRFK